MKKSLKLIVAFVLAACLVFTLVACGNNQPKLEGTYDITVWVSELAGVKELTQQQIAKFCELNPGLVINATVEGISESESATQMITSVEDGADIFCFAQDQLSRLVMAGALAKLGVATGATVTEMNDAGAVAAASVGTDLYCYPLTSDNGYFMYYDKSVIDEAHLDSLEDIIADCEAAGKMFSFSLETSAWYNASFFFATGCVSKWTTDIDGKFVSVNDDFNSDKGLIALKGMQKLLKSPCYISSDAHADFAAAIPSAVVISGPWGTTVAKEALGDNFGATDLPSFTVDGQTYHLGSYSGNKLLGVKPQTDANKAAVLQQLALYLTGEACQMERFNQFAWGPSNKAAQGNDAVKNDVALNALAMQAAYAVPQEQIHGSWWDIAKVYAVTAKSATTDQELVDALAQYKTSIDGLFTIPADVKDAFTVIGAFGTANWDTDEHMTEKDGAWYTDAAINFAVGNEFQVRQGLSWDVQFGAVGDDGFSTKNNFVVAEAGYYFVKLVFDKDAGTGVVSLVKSNPIYGFTVIGSINGDTWSIDLPMEIQADGTWLTTEAYDLAAGDEFKVRQGLGWDCAYGTDGNNFVVETAGNYKIKLSIVDGNGIVELVSGN